MFPDGRLQMLQVPIGEEGPFWAGTAQEGRSGQPSTQSYRSGVCPPPRGVSRLGHSRGPQSVLSPTTLSPGDVAEAQAGQADTWADADWLKVNILFPYLSRIIHFSTSLADLATGCDSSKNFKHTSGIMFSPFGGRRWVFISNLYSRCHLYLNFVINIKVRFNSFIDFTH